MNNKAQYFPALTGLRAIAAYLVYLHHFPIIPYQSLAQQLHIGVGIFFTLSGFLIYYRYAESINLEGDWWRKYIINRFARIYPLYLCLSILTLMSTHAPTVEWITNLSLTRGFFDGLKFTGIAQGWSLTVEECFYLSAPFIFLAVRRHKIWLPLSLLGIYAIGFGLISLGQQVSFYGLFKDFTFMAIYTFFGRAFDFFVGMFVAILFLARPNLNLKLATPLSILGIGSVVAYRMYLETIQINYRHPLNIFLNNIMLPIFFGLLLWGLLTEINYFSRFLGSRVMGLLGKSSYAFYLIHIGLIATIVKPKLEQFSSNPNLTILLHFIVMNILAIILFRFLEEPLNNLIRGLINGKKEEIDLSAPTVEA